MNTLPGLIIAQIKTTVEINGIATPFNLSLTSLQRFCRPLLFHRNHDIYELAYSGSSFLFRCRGHNFLLCTRHQIKGEFSPADICIVVEEEDARKIGLSPNATNRIRIDSYLDRTAEDILLIEYHSERNGRDLSPYFLRFDPDTVRSLGSVSSEQVVIIFAIGYPTRFADYEVKFDETDLAPIGLEVVSRWCKLYLQPREATEWDLSSRIPVKVHEKYPADVGDPDGFSG